MFSDPKRVPVSMLGVQASDPPVFKNYMSLDSEHFKRPVGTGNEDYPQMTCSEQTLVTLIRLAEVGGWVGKLNYD